jgi:hypothetical protein
VRPAKPLICAFIDEHRDRFGVAPVCRALAVHGVQIAARTYWSHRSASLPSTTRSLLPGARCCAVTGFSCFKEELSNDVESQGLQ